MDENITVSSNTNERANHLVEHISRVCDASMERRRSASTRRPMYWYNSEIALPRRSCHNARQRYQRSRGESDDEILRAVFMAKRRELKIDIKRSNSFCFKELCDKVVENLWRGAYTVVMSKIRTCKISEKNSESK